MNKTTAAQINTEIRITLPCHTICATCPETITQGFENRRTMELVCFGCRDQACNLTGTL